MYINILLNYFIMVKIWIYIMRIFLYFFKGVKVNNFLEILSVAEFDK
jgi:hypothetical protein